MSGLGLVPNEVVGYRITADSHNWVVVLVKKHGKDSKFAGQEYVAPLGYYRDIANALQNVHTMAMRDHLANSSNMYLGTEEQWIEALAVARAAVDRTAQELADLIGSQQEQFRKFLRNTSHAVKSEDADDEND